MSAGQPPYEALQVASYRKSSRSSGAQECVLVGTAQGWVGIRDSKLGDESPILAFTEAEWKAFTAGVRHSEFDL
ncbi:MAG TPA: DUF397 domain-containing protein [Pseudonocardiaceae bacterium]|nr:DUF397 domain-containing protein [Pseudonocardiaceae bacterium]